MILEFTLHMPGVCSWNGKWSGEGRHYSIIKTFRGKKKEGKARKLCDVRSFYHNFSDGWCARVDVKHVTSTEAAKSRKASVGFAGYNWMVESILNYGQIFDTIGLKKHLAQQADQNDRLAMIAACKEPIEA